MLNSKLKEPPKKKFTVKLVNLGVKVFFSKKKKKKKKNKNKNRIILLQKNRSEIGETNSNQRTRGYLLV